MEGKVRDGVVWYWENQATRIECAWSIGLSWMVAIRFRKPIVWKNRVVIFE